MAIDRVGTDPSETGARAGSASPGHLSTPLARMTVAAAPMAAAAGIAPLALALGNGPSLPLAYLVTGLVLLLLAAGPASSGGLLATASYGAVTIGLASAVGSVPASFGVRVPWPVGAAVGIAVVGLLGYREVEPPVRVLGVLVGLEVLALVLFDVAVLLEQGTSALPPQSLSPNTVARGGVAGSGLVLLFALTSCMGLMPGLAAGRSGQRRRPSYVAVALIAGFLFATGWVLVGSIATGQTAGLTGLTGSDLVPALAASYVGTGFGAVVGLLLCASLLALMLATHRAAARAVGPTARTRASLVLTGVTAAVVAIGAVAGLDPYLTVAAWLTGLGALGVLLPRAVAALASLAARRQAGS